MQILRSQIRWSVVVGLLMSFVVGAAFSDDSLWEMLGILPLRPPFADLVAILAAGQAQVAGLDVYTPPNPFDPFGRPHVYGPGWLVTGWMGLRVEDGWWLGILLTAVFVGVALGILGPRGWRSAMGTLFFLISPPVLLAINRGNNDLVVFLLAAGAAGLLARPGWRATTVGGGLLGLAGVLKLYPLAALPIIVMRHGRWRNLVTAGVILVMSCVAVLWFWRDDYQRALSHVPRPPTIFGYGFLVTLNTWRALPNFRGPFIFGWVAAVTTALLLLGPRLRVLWSAVPVAGFTSLCFLAGTTCWCFCFVANSNYAYRLVLLLLPARLWLQPNTDSHKREVGYIQLVLWILVFWIAVPKNWWARLASTDPTLSDPAWTWLRALAGIDQGLTTILTVALAIGVVGAFARKLQAARAEGT